MKPSRQHLVTNTSHVHAEADACRLQERPQHVQTCHYTLYVPTEALVLPKAAALASRALGKCHELYGHTAESQI